MRWIKCLHEVDQVVMGGIVYMLLTAVKLVNTAGVSCVHVWFGQKDNWNIT